MKKRLVLFVITFAVILIVFGACGANDSKKVLITKYFTDIEQFNAMDEYVTEDLSTEDDKYLNDVSYAESYTKQLEFDGMTYQVYAYEFNSTEDARKYYEALGGKVTSKRFNYTVEATGSSKSYCAVIYDKCVHCFRGGKLDALVEAYNYLTDGFPVCYKTLDNAVTDAGFGLYQFYGDEKFSKVINENSIDPYIRAKYDQTENSYVSLSFVTDEEHALWEAELDNALKKLRLCLEEEDLAKFNTTQIAWEADLEADLEWQYSLCANNPLNKEHAQIEQIDAIYAIKLYEADLYRQRTIEVKYFHYLYDKNADLSFVFKG